MQQRTLRKRADKSRPPRTRRATKRRRRCRARPETYHHPTRNNGTDTVFHDKQASCFNRRGRRGTCMVATVLAEGERQRCILRAKMWRHRAVDALKASFVTGHDVALIRRPANWIKAGLMLKSFRSGRRARSRTEQVLSISFRQLSSCTAKNGTVSCMYPVKNSFLRPPFLHVHTYSAWELGTRAPTRLQALPPPSPIWVAYVARRARHLLVRSKGEMDPFGAAGRVTLAAATTTCLRAAGGGCAHASHSGR